MPAGSRLVLAVAATQFIADAHSIDILHIKGFAGREFIPDRTYADVDVLVRPDQEEALLAAMREAGWEICHARVQRGRESHATDVLAHAFGVKVDVHENFPGVGIDPSAAFDLMWAGRRARSLAGFEVAFPGRVDNALLLALHSARCARNSPRAEEGLLAWTALSSEDRAKFSGRARQLEAESVLGVTLPAFASETTSRDRELYNVVGQQKGRLEVWLARIRHAQGVSNKARLAVGILTPRSLWGTDTPWSVKSVLRHNARILWLTSQELRTWRRRQRRVPRNPVHRYSHSRSHTRHYTRNRVCCTDR